MAVGASLTMMALLAFAALAVDLGSFFVERRKLQSAADLAALAAASDLVQGRAAAEAAIVDNGYQREHLVDYGAGVYRPDSTLAPSARFARTAAAGQNAAEVRLSTEVPTFFGRFAGGDESVRLNARAVASRTAFANFSIGSRLLSVDGGLQNAILGGLLGTSVNLNVIDYRALADADVDLLAFSSALATELRLTGVSYDELLSREITLPQAYGALAAAAGSDTAAGRTLDKLARAVDGDDAAISLDALLDLGGYGQLDVDVDRSGATRATVDALSMVSAVAEAAAGDRQVAIDLAGLLPAGVQSANLRIAIGEPPQGRSWISVGPEGTTVHTAQSRVLLTVSVASTAPASLITLPIYLELASGEARLKTVTCGFPEVSSSSAVLEVRPGIAEAWVGEVSTGAFYDMTRDVSPGPARLVNAAPLLRVNASAHAALVQSMPRDVRFDYADITAGTVKTASTSIQFGMIARLLADLQLDVELLPGAGGLTLPLGGALKPATTAAVRLGLAQAENPIDLLLGRVLDVLGVGLGEADVRVHGLRCDGGGVGHLALIVA